MVLELLSLTPRDITYKINVAFTPHAYSVYLKYDGCHHLPCTLNLIITYKYKKIIALQTKNKNEVCYKIIQTVSH